MQSLNPFRLATAGRVLFAAVLLLLGVVGVQAADICRGASERLRESTLRWQLSAMRIAIDDYTLDKERPPRSLKELVDAHYLREVPTDPFTESKDWVCEIGEIDLGPEFKAWGLYDVHSRSNRTAGDGTRYASW